MDKKEKLTESLAFQIKPEDFKSLREVVLEAIRNAIITGELEPGQQLKERELAALIGTSTTPIKEALRILSHEGLVETAPRKGTFVSKMIKSSIKEILMLRANLESLITKLATEKMTEAELNLLESQVLVMKELVDNRSIEKLKEENTQFHMMICKAGRSPVIYQMIMNVVSFDLAFRDRTYKYLDEVEEGFLEHKQIFEAIKERNPILAEERMRNHILLSAERVLHKK